jgi:hypothetical protein
MLVNRRILVTVQHKQGVNKMKYFYIIDINGTVWGSFDSLTNAESFAQTLATPYTITNK